MHFIRVLRVRNENFCSKAGIYESHNFIKGEKYFLYIAFNPSALEI